MNIICIILGTQLKIKQNLLTIIIIDLKMTSLHIMLIIHVDERRTIIINSYS